MARLFADENFPLPVITELRRLGHDVLTVPDAGHARQAQRIHMAITKSAIIEKQFLSINRPAA